MGWLRYPRTTQERRANGKRGLLVVDSYVVRLRLSRSEANLPQAYDDIIRKDCRSRHNCWKLHRKVQYYRSKDPPA